MTRQRNRTTEHQKESPIAKSNSVQNDGIQPPNINQKKVKFTEEPTGIYSTGATSRVGALEDANYFISTGKKSNRIFVIPNSDTMSATERMKLAK